MKESGGGSLPTELWKGWGVHAFLGSLTDDSSPVPGLTGLTLLGVDQDGESHILQSFFFVPVGPYGLDSQLFGCREELPSEGQEEDLREDERIRKEQE